MDKGTPVPFSLITFGECEKISSSSQILKGSDTNFSLGMTHGEIIKGERIKAKRKFRNLF